MDTLKTKVQTSSGRSALPSPPLHSATTSHPAHTVTLR